jgi:hypothetical protein
MTKNKLQQKLVSFTDNGSELDNIKNDMQNGWSIISLVKNGSYYVGIMELSSALIPGKESIYIPPRKKIKISSGS